MAISSEDIGNEIETESFEFVEAERTKEDNSAFIEETNELTNSNQALINQAFDDFDEDDSVDIQEITESNDKVTPGPEFSDAAHITDTELEQPGQVPEIDLCEIVDKVTQDIMPELETQIRSLVLASLEKHLSDSINISMPDTSTDSDKDL